MNIAPLLLSYTDEELDRMKTDLNPRNLESWKSGAESLDPATFLLYRFLATTDRLRNKAQDSVEEERLKKFFGELESAIAADETKNEDFPHMTPQAKTQRALRGYADEDLWSFDSYLAWMLPPALEQLVSNEHIEYGAKMRKQVRKIVRDLRFYHANQYNYEGEAIAEADAKIPKVFKRLSKVFTHLWI
jgi:hypothetical protein